MNNYKENENKLRDEKFAKDQAEENFLESLNNTLKTREESCYSEISNRFPFIFLVGLPRSGTTFATQLIAQTLDIGYINNLIARFWKAPVQGIMLSNIILDDNPEFDFNSSYGKTSSVNNIHEFSYFWLEWLKMEHIPPYDPEKASKEINWEGLKKTLLNMAAAFGKGIVFKGLNPGYHINKLNQLLPQSLFIYLERNLGDVAYSLYKARIEYYKDPNKWWSAYPIEYNLLKDLSYQEQIAGQVHYLRKYYLDQFQSLPDSQKLIVNYEQTCSKPNQFIDKIIEKMNKGKKMSAHVTRNHELPQSFKISKHGRTNGEYQEINEQLKKMEQKVTTS